MSDPLVEEQPSRYVVGIDLGTTNSAVCYVDCDERPWKVRVLEIPQLVAPGQVEARDTLPSFHFQPPAGETASGGRQLSEPIAHMSRNATEGVPYSAANYVVGFMARDHGAAVPGRLIASAKSWLCHAGVDRTAELLPWHAAADVERISPVEASSRYLAHIRSGWNRKFKSEPLERQEIVLTLPASFDEIARELTVQASARAGLPRVVLIEEPQAAFYAWIYKHQENWEQLVSPGQTILVCDVGGGTTDFTLIRVRRGEQDKVQFHRVAVGDHLLLGGDNMDLALAQHLEGTLMQNRPLTPLAPEVVSTASNDVAQSGVSPSRREGTTLGKLSPRQWDVLLRVSRQVKEQMLSDDGPEEMAVTVPGAGSKLIGGALQTKVTRDEVRQLLVEGFMPRVKLSGKPAARRSGFQEFGLPFAADAAITRHLAAFLSGHGEEETEVRGQGTGDRGQETGDRRQDQGSGPDVLLFNGGVFESGVLRQRLSDVLADWFPSRSRAPSPQPRVPQILDNDRLDLAVARGAAYYGMVRRGEGVKIVASLARTYYIGVEIAAARQEPRPPERNATEGVPYSAMCLVPGDAEPGVNIVLAERQIDLLVSEPVEFPLYTSSIRLTDRPGELVPFDPEQMTALPPIRTALRTRSRRERGTVPVHLHAKLSEIGTLELWCSEVGGERTWRLEFDVRSATQTDLAAHETDAEAQGFVDETTAAACRRVLERTFGPAGIADPATLIKRLTAESGMERIDWPTSLLRRIWDSLMELERGRRRSAEHEARWLNLLGYALRPGYGMAVDDWRVVETWKSVQGKLAHGAASSRTESLILWRRIAGGLTQGQQRALAEPLLAVVRTLYKRQTGSDKGTDPTFRPHETLEVLRLLGSLELLAGEVRIELGQMLVELLSKKKLAAIRPAIGWALGRVGAREPAYGPLNTVVPATEATAWIEKVLEIEAPDPMAQFAIVNLTRRTGDRFRDIGEDLRERVLDWLERHGAGEHARTLVRSGGQLDAEEQSRVFGESLPNGLRLR